MHSSLPDIRLENFEGPFDLLLELARTNEVDLSEVSLGQITEEFLEYVRSQAIPASAQADFLVVAATLLLIKLRQVLPELTSQEEDEIADLTDRLRLYQLYREQALDIQRQWRHHPLLPGPEQLQVQGPSPNEHLTAGFVAAAMQRVIEHLPVPVRPTRHLRRRGRSVTECLALLQERLRRTQEVSFIDVASTVGREGVGTSLLAVLALLSRQEIEVEQPGLFEAILIRRRSRYDTRGTEN